MNNEKWNNPNTFATKPKVLKDLLKNKILTVKNAPTNSVKKVKK